MTKRIAIVFFVLVVFSAGGCKTLGKKGEYPQGYNPAERVEYQLEAGNYGKAESIWVKTQSFMKANPEDAAQVHPALVWAATVHYNATLSGISKTLSDIEWPVEQPRWPLTARRMQKVAAFVDSVSDSMILPETGLEGRFRTLRDDYSTLEGRMKADASKFFQKYNLLTGKNFFSIYPVKLNEKSFIASQSAFLMQLLGKSEGSGVAHVNKLYSGYLTPELRDKMGRRYYRNALRRISPNKTPSLKAILEAAEKTDKAGYELSEIPDINIAFIRVTSKTLMKEHQIAFGLDIDLDLPFNATMIKGGGAFNDKVAPEADIVVLINEEMSRIDRRTSAYDKRVSTVLSGYERIDNPEYDDLEMRYQELREDIRDMRDEMQFNSFMGLGGAIANLVVSSKLEGVENEYGKVRAKLKGTPKKIKDPIYSKYSYSLVTIDDAKLATVNYYIVDRRKRTFYTDRFDVKQSQTFRVPYGVMEQDPDREQLLSGKTTEKDVEDYEREAVKVKLSSILKSYTNSLQRPRKYRSTAEIRKTILNDRNKAVADYKKTQFKSDTSNDVRFDSVVVIVCPGNSLGTGFYVTPDTVLTNFHVVEDGKFVELLLHNGMESFGKVEVYDAERDLALLKVQSRGKPVTFYDRQSIPAGTTLEAIGHPSGLKYTITRGVFSALRTVKGVGVVGKKRKVRYIQTDASVNPGNSGGPLYMKDKVVGVNTWGRTDMQTTNFAIHYSEVMDFLDQYNVDYRRGGN